MKYFLNSPKTVDNQYRGPVLVKVHNGYIYALEFNPGGVITSMINRIYEREDIYLPRSTWRGATPKEEEFLNGILPPYHQDEIDVDYDIECRGHEEYQDVIAKLKYDGVIVSDIDYYRCEITYTCLRCGRKIVRSFFDNSSNVCPHCHMEKYAYGTLSLEDAREKRASICGHSRTDYFDIEISPKEKEDKLVFTVSEDEQTLTVLVVGEESRCGEDAIYLRHYLKYLLTYSLKPNY